MLHEHGISISYDIVLEVSAQLGDAVVSKYIEDGVVCPPVLRKGLFTTAAMDNIDHNPSSTTATSAFHGTSISVFQHPTKDNEGEERDKLQFGEEKVKTVPELPDSFTNVKPAFFRKKNPLPPPSTEADAYAMNLQKPDLSPEFEWLQMVILTEGTGALNVTWSTHHARKKRSPDFEVTIASLLPLLRDAAHTVATVRHVMEKIQEVVQYLNPGQIPVVTADQPIYAVAKQIQWHWPEQYGENRFVIMLGGLHIEMAALKSLGSFLQKSGWTSALVEAGIASPGTAESFLTASSITRTRQMHQVTCCSVYKLLKAAYDKYTREVGEISDEFPSFEDWCDSRRNQNPQFEFWFLVLSMELVILTLIRSIREANFSLYCQSLSELIPFFFANNNVNYARWLPIHLRDMVTLREKHPQLAEEFQKGHFVVHKTNREVSALAIDQAHEQANAVIKGEGGAVGVTEDPSALRRWSVAGPEVSHLVEQYQVESEAKETPEHTHHHEQTPHAQRVFLERVHKLYQVLEAMGNPFNEDSADLYSLDTKDVAHPSAAELVLSHHERGRIRYQEFLAGMEREEPSLYNPIKKGKTDFFRQEPPSAVSAKQNVLKDDCQLFSKLFISCQNRECDLQEFFCHENQSFPAALSEGGRLYSCQKSQLANILENYVTTPTDEPSADAIVIDGSELIYTLPPRTSKTFDSYATLDVLPVIKAYTMKYSRTDVVFDVYLPSSLKSETRSCRGQGIRRKVTASGKLPSNWQSCMRDSENKTELFLFLADRIATITSPNLLNVTKGDEALTNHDISLEGVAPCQHEEANTRIFVHVRHAAEQGCKSVIIKACDTDVLVIAASVMPLLQNAGLQQLWVAFGQGVNIRWIPIHDLLTSVGFERCRGLSFFHAFTGCDVVSAFRGRGKKSAWQTWDVCAGATEAFSQLSQYPPTLNDDNLETIEQFVVLMYDRGSSVTHVDEARLDLFARKQRPYQAIPPTRASLLQHVKRAVYQASSIWGQATLREPEVQSPADWGWSRKEGMWQVVWTTLPPIAQSCQQLTKCGCKTECRGRCKCYRFGLTCTALCSCRCEN